MAASETLANMRSRVRLFCDQRTSDEANNFLTDAEVDVVLNQELKKVYNKLVEARGHEYYSTTVSISITAAGGASYALPADHMQTLSIVLNWSADRIETVHDFSLDEKPTLDQLQAWTEGSIKGFRIIGANIVFSPAPDVTVTGSHTYVPAFTELTDDAHTFDGVAGWENLACWESAAVCQIIKRRDPKPQREQAAMLHAELNAMAANRAAREPKRVRITRGRPRIIRTARYTRDVV